MYQLARNPKIFWNRVLAWLKKQDGMQVLFVISIRLFLECIKRQNLYWVWRFSQKKRRRTQRQSCYKLQGRIEMHYIICISKKKIFFSKLSILHKCPLKSIPVDSHFGLNDTEQDLQVEDQKFFEQFI
ncbi:unnamed protein product [Paramecium octaurelia]|uniref:Uncharacterized protein n=1 Tax=Paramecium octaurelia TaxID=43137 RepID=A0A8S1T4Q9_PAROT|nr:unnamed protein product [Paramecium octaurelia]